MVSAGALTLLLAVGVTTPWDNALYDFHMRHWQYTPSDDVVIVAIDPKSLEALGTWPFARSVHARLIDRLTDLRVGAIGLNLAMPEADSSHPGSDRLLAQAIRLNGRVVMPVLAEASEAGGPLQESMPIPEIASAVASFGETDLPQDADGFVRGAYLKAGIRKPYWPLLAVAVYYLDHPQPHAEPGNERGTAQKHEDSPYVWSRDDYVLVHYAGPAGTFGTVSYVDVLDGNVDSSLLKGKTVLIGMTAQGYGERIATPGSNPHVPMPGVEYMANVLESLRRGLLIAPLDFARDFLVGAAALMFPLLIYGWPGLRRPWVVAVVSVLAMLLTSLLLLRLANVWWPPMSAIVVLVAASAVWGVVAPRLHRESRLSSERSSSPVEHF